MRRSKAETRQVETRNAGTPRSGSALRAARLVLAAFASLDWAGAGHVAAAQDTDARRNGLAARIDPYVAKQRLIVLTDIANEPDDQMSLVRLLVYSNQFDVEGLIAATSTWMKQAVRPDVIRRVIAAYEQVQPNLLIHAPSFPSGDALRRVVATGQPTYGMNAVGPAKMTRGAELIIRAAERNDPRPLWIAVWGARIRSLKRYFTPGRQIRSCSWSGSCRSSAYTRSLTRTTPGPGSVASSRACTTSPRPLHRTASSTRPRRGPALAATDSTRTRLGPTSPPSPPRGSMRTSEARARSERCILTRAASMRGTRRRSSD